MGKERGFSFSLVLLLLGVVIVAGVSGGVYYMARRDEAEGVSTLQDVVDIEANGTVKNAVEAANDQLSAEVTAEESALDIEDEASELSESDIAELEDIANDETL